MGIIRNVGNLHDDATGLLVGYINPLTGKEEALAVGDGSSLGDSGSISGGTTLTAATRYYHDKWVVNGGGVVTLAADLASSGLTLAFVPGEGQPDFTIAIAPGVTLLQEAGTTLSSAEAVGRTVIVLFQEDGKARALSGAQALRLPEITATRYQGLQAVSPWHDAVVPLGTSAINQASVTGGTVAPVVDSAVLWAGKPTTRLDISGTPSAAIVEAGLSGATFALSNTAQGVLSKTLSVALKGAEVTGAKNVTSVSIYIGDAAYSNFHVLLLTTYVDTADGWRVFSRAASASGTLSTTGSPNLSAAVRCKLRLTFAGGNPSGGTSIWASQVSVSPTPKASVILTCDDGTDGWSTYLLGALRDRGLRASCGLDAGYINTPGFLTTSQARELQQSGVVELTNHGANNQAYSAVGLAPYLANLDTCDALLQSVGATSLGRKLHAYVQGSRDATLIAAMQAKGFVSMREVGAEGRLVLPLLTKKIPATSWGMATSYHSRFDLPAALNLGSSTDLTECYTLIEEAKKAGGTVVVMGHQFGGSVALYGWVAGYHASYGMSNLLDYLAFERAAGNIDVPTWGKWVTEIDQGAAV